ncbi:MAG: ornithine cyclodeaminase family protein [Leucobacter sp.]|nr:ornithine cyclodeaminase family protein [Leucobacter sp.]
MNDAVYFSRDDVLSLSAEIDVESALQHVLIEAELGEAGQATRTELAPEGLASVLGLMPGYRTAAPAVFAAKVVCVVPGNPVRGLPAHHGVVLLFDASTGALLVMADAGAVTEVRTAALTALATRTLATRTEGISLVVGGGHQAVAHLRALARLQHRLVVWARRPEQARGAIEMLAVEGVDVAFAPKLESAVREAAVVTTVTGTAEPILDAAWFGPGALLNAIGSSTPRVREVPEEMIRTSFLVADSPEAVRALSGEFSRLDRPGPALHSLGSLLHRPDSIPETRSNGCTVFKSVGVPLQDLALASELYRAATDSSNRSSSIGQRIRL